MSDPGKLPMMSRGRLAPPDITEEEMVQQLQNYPEAQFSLGKTPTKFGQKYNTPQGQWTLDDMRRVWVLTDAVSSASSLVSAAWKDPLEGGHDTVPDEWDLVKKIHKELFVVICEGPY
ncbi:hypothetical protein chiPu_0010790 [Chiloscyllium punctatum]|uniref:Uncharacterized protein n=1 Tax=Chiloscyllium punctatum TaxID=137246 RepID=A0A401SPK0_CHIPU|nr:hypothetical protein [Chiloscyllium punctatum]